MTASPGVPPIFAIPLKKMGGAPFHNDRPGSKNLAHQPELIYIAGTMNVSRLTAVEPFRVITRLIVRNLP